MKILSYGKKFANQKNNAVKDSVNSHQGVVEVVELLTMHLAPKQILVTAHINMKDDLTNEQIFKSINEIEESIKNAESKVDMIFLERQASAKPPSKK